MKKLFNFIIKPFYYKKNIKTIDQLKDDFGEFPPYPLKFKDKNYDFNLIKVNKIGIFFYYLSDIYKIMLKEALFDDTASDFRKLKKDVANLHNEYGFLYILVFFFLILLISPFVILYILVKSFLFGLKVIRLTRSKLGYFLPLMKQRNVVVRAGKHEIEEYILTHEHLHYLQYRSPYSKSKSINLPSDFLSSTSDKTSYIFYLLEKNELEARLHEIILSFYRKNKNIPLSFNSYLSIFDKNNDFKSLLTNYIDFDDFHIDDAFHDYDSRSLDVADDFNIIFLSVNEKYTLRIVTEVLSVMYGHLIYYYGDEKSSEKFLHKIPRPNLYDVLYG